MPEGSLKQDERYSFFSLYWKERRKPWLIPLIMSSILLQLLILGNMSYIYGSLFKSSSRVHNLKILAVDYDGSYIGQSLLVAYSSVKSDSFPTLEYRSATEYQDPESLRHAVCKGGYWAAIYTHAGATDRLLSALDGNSSAAYDPRETITYIYNGVNYPVVAISFIVANLQELITVASRTIYTVAGQELLSLANLTSPASSSVFFDPIEASTTNILPTNQGTRVLLNTVTMVIPALMQFFFSMAANNISAEHQVFAKLRKRDVYIFRLVLSKLYCFLCGLCNTAFIMAFKEDWGVGTGKFFETWMCFWLFHEINYLVIDTLLVTVIPMAAFPFFIFTWVIMGVTSTIFPFALSAGFYKLGYALPAHNFWTLLVGVWSGGCGLRKDIALPVLLSWWFVGHFTSAWATRRRCTTAELAEEQGMLDPDIILRSPSHATTGDLDRSMSRAAMSRIES